MPIHVENGNLGDSSENKIAERFVLKTCPECYLSSTVSKKIQVKRIGHNSPEQDLMSQANLIYAKSPGLFHPSKSRFVLAGNKEILEKRKLSGKSRAYATMCNIDYGKIYKLSHNFFSKICNLIKNKKLHTKIYVRSRDA